MKVSVKGGWRIVGGVSLLLVPGALRAQENRVDISARAVQTYDTNLLRRGRGGDDRPTDNVSVSPGLTINLNRNFARQRVFLQGAAQYVFNSRYRFLNRENLNFTGGAQLRFGPRCQINPTALLFRAQSDQDDLGEVTANGVTIQDYALSVSCPRPAGFYPTVSGSYQQTDNSRRVERSQSVRDGRFGLVYRRPSLGEAEVFGQLFEIRRNRFFAGNVQDTTSVQSVGVRMSRGVGTRLAVEGAVAYTEADPVAGLQSFSGVNYRGTVSYRFAPRLGVNANVNRAITAAGNVGTSYLILRNAEVGANAKLSARTSAGASVAIAERQFRGEDPIFGRIGRGSDRQLTLQGNVGYQPARPIVLDLSARYRDRDALNDQFDYSSVAATLSASLSF